MLALLIVGFVAFVSTNMDDLVVLVALWCDPPAKSREVYLGQLLATFALLAVAIAFGRMAILIPERWLGLAGLLPIAVGISRLVKHSTFQEDEDDNTDSSIGRISLAGVFLVTIGNGTDNLAVYSSLTISRAPTALAVFALEFIVLTLIWCRVTRAIASHKHIARVVERSGGLAVPWVLIAIGLYVLLSSSTFGALLHR